MRVPSPAKLRAATGRHRLIVQEALLLAACMVFAALAAYFYDIFPNPPGVPTQVDVIEPDEAFALAMLLCLGLLALSWQFLLSQRREVARRIAAERRARELAMQDGLTGLPNRRQFDHELQAAIEAPPRKGGAHAVFLLDLNGFKHVIVRFGGDEFAILARQLAGSEDATSIALRVVKEFEHPIVTGAIQHRIGIGIGLALIPQDGTDEIEILRKADIAMYRAKAEGQSVSRFFDAEMDARIRERDLIERDLRPAIADGSIEPYYQPLVELGTGRVIGFEALP
ncbi:MAG: diguanylate cyclase, partial [Pseudolabrys sp.]